MNDDWRLISYDTKVGSLIKCWCATTREPVPVRNSPKFFSPSNNITYYVRPHEFGILICVEDQYAGQFSKVLFPKGMGWIRKSTIKYLL